MHRSATALVTGASSGIGAAFARRLAAQGYHLVLVARRAERLQALAASLQGAYPVTVEVLPADLADADGIERVADRIAAHDDLEMLVNNAGFGINGPFIEEDIDRQIDMVQVHVVATMRLCRAALPGMIARRRGTIINVSSIAAFMPVAGQITYSSTKAYLNVFSAGLQAELRGTGVRVQALCPGFTRTEFHDTPELQRQNIKSRIPNILWMPADAVAAASLEAVKKGPVIYIPGLKNRVFVAAARTGFLPLMSKVRAILLRRM